MTSETSLRVSAPDSHYALVHYICRRSVQSTQFQRMCVSLALLGSERRMLCPRALSHHTATNIVSHATLSVLSFDGMS